MNGAGLLIVFAFDVAIAGLLLSGSFLAVQRDEDREKLSSYECGFDPFVLPQSKFDVQFFLVALLFIIFDLELIYIFPWCLAVGDLGLFGLGAMYLFLFILTMGFVYEWISGGLNWTDPSPGF
jgi:NADH:ubiquinone oxidoreductase subunit 3 (subunit A)